MLSRLISAGIQLVIDIRLLSLPGRLRDCALDTVLGPAERWEYTPKTRPSGPPPYIP